MVFSWGEGVGLKIANSDCLGQKKICSFFVEEEK